MRHRPRALAALLVAQLAALPAAGAQRLVDPSITRAHAIAAATEYGARLAMANADTSAASAQLQAARAWQNPTFAASYSKSTPNYHYTLELPLDLPYQRRPRIGAAAAAQRAARYRLAWERASVEMEADTTYTRALAARAIRELSSRSARDADSLRRMAVARRDAGDASDMDVALASVTAGQAANQAASDSLAFLSAMHDLQAVMGLNSTSIEIALADSLTVLPSAPPGTTPAGFALPVAAASAQLEAASLTTTLERRSVFGALGVMAGVETGDPSGSEPGRLPTFGLSVPLPLFNRNRGPIAVARAEEARARAELAFARTQTIAELGRVQWAWRSARGKVERDQQLVAQAGQVAAMALTAYREGAASMANVLEAQRTARELLAQSIRDLADAWIAVAELKVLTLTAAPAAP